MSKLKILALLAVMVCAMSAAAAPAFAVNEYEALRSPWEFAGGNTGSHVFTFGSEAAECELASFKGEQPVPATTVGETPLYAKCTVFGDVHGTVTVNHCAYELDEPQGGTLYEASMAIINSGGTCEIRFSGSSCKVTVAAQATERPFLLEENVTRGAMKVFFIGTEIEYSHGGTCPGIGSGHDGTYEGTENIEQLNIV